MSWLDLAACRGEDPELFFPVGNDGPALIQQALAITVCRRCPALIQCRTWALAAGETAGVWGGLTADERRAARTRWSVPRPAYPEAV